MKVPLAWRILTDDKRRTALALIGIFMAILLVFVELGFFYAVPRGGLLLYDNMRFDLLLASNQYEYQAQPGAFPHGELEKVRSSPDVAEATPIYFGVAKWKSGEGDPWPDVFMIGYDPASHIFIPDSINRQTALLAQVDSVLVDSSTRPIFGPLDHSCYRITIDKPLSSPTLHHLGTGRQERAATKLLITSVDHTPIDRRTQRTMMRVVTFIEDLIRTDVDLPDIWRAFDSLVASRISAAN
jgi:hypothetical protein